MNLKHVGSLLGYVLPLSLPLCGGCSEDIDLGESDDSITKRVLPAPTQHRISASNLASLVLRSDGTVTSSGDNTHGQLGDGTTVSRTSPGPVLGLSDVTLVSASTSNYSLAVTADGKLWSWGSDLWGQLGNGPGPDQDQPSPTQISGLSGVTTATAAYLHGLAVTSDGVKPDGTVWAWGINNSGQLGDGTNLQRKAPVPISGLSGVTAVAGGSGHSLALKDGTVFAWGKNSEGQLGDGTLDNRNTPAPIDGLGDIVAIAAAGTYSLALQGDGTVYAWGNTALQRVGCTLPDDPTVPTPVAGLANITALAAGEKNILALQEDGTVLGWGRNGHGELGDGSNVQRCAPVPASGLVGVTAIAVGTAHSLAQTSNGQVLAFGFNNHGQLGDGADITTNRKTPVPTTFNGGADCLECATWPMPNPVSTALPNPTSYTSKTDSVVDDVTGLEWQQTPGCAAGCTQANADAYCEGLALAGHSDWRLPTRIELVSLVDDSEHAPAIDPVFPGTPNGYFWTSSPMVFFPDNAFRIGGNEGDTAYGMVSDVGPARCVREPAAAPASDYEVHAGGTPSGTVVDTGTWLTWQQQVAPQTYSLADAISYCSNNAAGLPGSGWRLPSMKELQTIVDDSQVSPAIDGDAFPNTPIDAPYWTSTPVSWQPGYAWYVLFNIGQSNHKVATSLSHVRCVR